MKLKSKNIKWGESGHRIMQHENRTVGKDKSDQSFKKLIINHLPLPQLHYQTIQ